MKNRWFLLLLFTLSSNWSYGQLLPKQQAVFTKTGIIKIKIKQPLILLGSLETNENSLILDLENLQIIKTYQDSLELVRFGEKGKDGVVIAALKNKTALQRLPAVLDYFKVPAKDRTLKVLVDNALINPDLFLADVKRIKRIDGISPYETSLVRDNFNKEEEYLNIVTVKD